MNARRPKVSIGLPVYNGEDYLQRRLDSLLNQTFEDIELVVSDNASTDGTQQIVLERAARDKRVRYHRNEQNIGGFPNHDLVFKLSRGEYFMWAGVDDLHHPDYVASCVEVLNREPQTVICYTATRYIDDNDREIPTKEVLLDIAASRPSRRFEELIRLDHSIEPVLGLIRSDILHRTRLMPTYPDSDRVMVAELGLHGPFHRLPMPLFSRRAGDENSTVRYPGRRYRMRWIDPRRRRWLVLPYHRQVYEFFRTIGRVPLAAGEKSACCGHVLHWCARHCGLLGSDVKGVGYDILRPVVRPLRNRFRQVL